LALPERVLTARAVPGEGPRARTLLLGMGNPILSDDAVGVRLAHDLGIALRGTPGLEVVPECSAGGLALLDLIAGYDRVVVVDSIKTRGGHPGDWYRFTAASLRETMNLRNVHDANFATALALGRRLGHLLPPDEEIHVFAVEIEENAEFSESLSPALERSYEGVLSGMLDEIRSLVGPGPIR
jgi:hydrogenase maturation protease